MAYFYGDEYIETANLDPKRPSEGPTTSSTTRFMRRQGVPRRQASLHSRNHDTDIEETLGSGSRELGNPVYRGVDMGRVRARSGREYRTSGPRY
jgi:hypothetical protein